MNQLRTHTKFKIQHYFRFLISSFKVKFDNIAWIDKNVRFLRFKKNISFGENAVIKSNTIICSCNIKAKISFGNNVSVGYNNLIFASQNIEIGNHVMIAPNVHIVDSNHKVELGKYIMFQENETKEILIHDDVWIGSGCVILAGSIIEKGVVIAANSVVRGRLIKNSIYAGSPVKYIKPRL